MATCIFVPNEYIFETICQNAEGQRIRTRQINAPKREPPDKPKRRSWRNFVPQFLEISQKSQKCTQAQQKKTK